MGEGWGGFQVLCGLGAMPVSLTNKSVYIPVQCKEKQMPFINFLQFNLFMFRKNILFCFLFPYCMNIMYFYTDSTRTVIVNL